MNPFGHHPTLVPYRSSSAADGFRLTKTPSSPTSSNVQQQLLTPRAPQIYGLARAESLADMK
ncbi:MAG: hypothetical protein L6R35_004281 [Caloplaca aegaea]|nr:MAG: hypothetical protein L6R35_004281 [Caloplaca aegaea]